MGLIHSRASKKRDRAEADLLREQAKGIRTERKAAQREEVTEQLSGQTDHPEQWWREPTVASLIGRRRAKQ